MDVTWLLCCYRLPRQPSRLRLGIWRRLKRIGALTIHDSVWILPADPQTREDFEWLAEEVEELGGRALLWEGRSIPGEQDADLIRRFRADAEERYRLIRESAAQLARLARRARIAQATIEQALHRLRGLERTARLERRRDYFRAPGRREANDAVEAAIGAIRARAEAASGGARTHAVGD
jgi:Protein ChrB, N-terminal